MRVERMVARRRYLTERKQYRAFMRIAERTIKKLYEENEALKKQTSLVIPAEDFGLLLPNGQPVPRGSGT